MTSRAVAILGAIVCSVVCLSHPSTSCGAEYTARSTLLISRQEPTLLARNARTISREEFQAYKKVQPLWLKSRDVLRFALAKPDVAKLPSVREQADAIRWLSGAIKVELSDDADVMSVSCTRNDPKEAALLTKAVVDAYMTEIVNGEAERKKQRCSDLERIVSEKELQLRRKLEAMSQLSAMLEPDNAKAAKRPAPVDIQMLQLDIDVLRDFLHEIRVELERAKVELQAPPRICVLTPAEQPLTPD